MKQESTTTKPSHEAGLSKEKLPQCMRCNKLVEKLTVYPHPSDDGQVIIEFNCHGETVSQEVSASVLNGPGGLSRYKVYNSLTSGMMPKTNPKPSRAKKNSKNEQVNYHQ